MPKKQNSSVEREMIFLRQMKEKMEKIVDKESKYSYLDMLKQNNYNTPESNKNSTVNTGLTTSTATGNCSHFKNKDDITFKRMKSFEYLNNQINKVSKKCELSDQEDFFSDDCFNSLTSKDLPKILSPSILHTLQTNSNTKNIKNSSVKNGCIDNKIQERESAEVPEFEINKSSAKESDSDELLLNIHFSKDNSKNTKSNELENKRKDIGYNIKPVKIKSRNNQELFNNCKSESINPSIIKIKNKDKNAVIHFNGKHNFSQLKIKDINTLNTQRNNMVDGLNKETRRKLNAQSKYSHPFSEFIKNSEKVKHNEEMFKKIFKKNLKRKTSFKFLGLGNCAQNTKESKYTNGGDKREKNNVLQDPTTIHISKNDLVENEVSINFCPTKINEEKLKLYRIKEYRSKSHDPTSNRYFRGSIQLNEIEKISECHNRRINSVRKERKQPNVTMVHNNLSSKLAFSKFINSPSRKLDKEYRDISIPSNELLQPKFDIFHHLNKFKIEQSREFGITARFGQANQPKCADYKNPILTPKDSKLSSPARMSFFSDECHDNFRYTFFPNNESEQKMSLNTKSKNNHRLPKIVINRKNFVFKDAIEQIRKDKANRASQLNKRRLNSFKSREVLSEEGYDRDSNRCFSNDLFSVGSEDFDKIELNPFGLANNHKSQKKLKIISKKIKKRPSDPIPLSKVIGK